jgi:hypothetical protein
MFYDTDHSFRSVRLAYQPPANNTFLSEQTNHQQPASSTFLSEQTSTSHQPPAKRTGHLCGTTNVVRLFRQSWRLFVCLCFYIYKNYFSFLKVL